MEILRSRDRNFALILSVSRRDDLAILRSKVLLRDVDIPGSTSLQNLIRGL